MCFSLESCLFFRHGHDCWMTKGVKDPNKLEEMKIRREEFESMDEFVEKIGWKHVIM